MSKNRLTSLLIFTCSFIGLAGCDTAPNAEVSKSSEQLKVENKTKQATQDDIDNIAKNLDVRYALITNVPSEKCDQTKEAGKCFEAQISFSANEAVMAHGWNIHFSHILPIQSFESSEFEVEHINGDLHKISLKSEFTGIKKGETKSLTFRALFWSLSEYDALPNYIVSAPNTEARVIESTKTAIDKDTGLEVLPFVSPITDYETQFKRTAADSTKWLTTESLYQRNLALGKEAQNVDSIIIPTPKSVALDSESKVLEISNGFKVDYANVQEADVSAAISRLSALGMKFSEQDNALSMSLEIQKNDSKAIGSYQLLVNEQGVKVVGVDGNGVFNGLQSLASLLTLDAKQIPQINIDDEPHYVFRGLLVDVARNFHSKAFILRLLDQMAAYKLNKLHLHLGDDEGWRLEIPSLPELTQVSGHRCFDLDDAECLLPQLGAGVDPASKVSGYYSVSDYQEILKAASARHIQVIPSLDMPGHSRAAIKAMAARTKKYEIAEQSDKAKQFNLYDPADTTVYSSVQYYNDNTINVCLESSYDFVTEVMTQVKKLHADAGQPLTRYHIGADETAGAWLDSPACKEFVENNDKGITDYSQLGAYFIERVAGILSDLDIETAGWSDGLEHTNKDNMPAIVQSNAWDVLFWGGHQKVHDLANRGWQIVISTPDALYFDFPYEADPKEHGYYWASRHTNTEKVFQFMPDNLPVHAEFWLDREDNLFAADDTKSMLDAGRKFYGIQGQLWSENTRTDATVEHKIFPRLFALAERAWHRPEWAVPYNYQGSVYNQDSKQFTDQARKARDAQWLTFANAIGQKALPKLERFNIQYRLPTVGAIVENGMLKANVAFPGLAIEYQVDNGPWQVYQGPVEVNGKVNVRSKTHDDSRASRTTTTK